MSEVIVITSGKGGVGETTTSANLGCGLAALGKKVALVDADIGLRNLDVVMGLENRIVYDLVDVVEGNCRLKQALIKDKRYDGLFLLPAAQTRDKDAVSPEQMQKLCDDLKEEGFDPARAVVIGDSVHDFEVAQALGVGCVLQSGGHQPPETLRKTGAPVVKGLREAAALILN